MDGSRYATLTYTIKASVYMTLGRVSHSIEDTFYLKALPDTRMPKLENDDLPKVRFTKYNIYTQPFIQRSLIQENCAYATIGGGCWFKPTHVELYMTLDKSVYKLGETIKVHVEASVKGGSSDVDKITGMLYYINFILR